MGPRTSDRRGSSMTMKTRGGITGAPTGATNGGSTSEGEGWQPGDEGGLGV